MSAREVPRMGGSAGSSTGRTIGVFDSGFGGLTVLRALLPRIPAAHYIYLGDTARLPYGAKSQATIARYAVESARFLESRGCEFLVIACNTATALALEDIRRAVGIPVLGVVEPGARAAGTVLLASPPVSNLPSQLGHRPPAPRPWHGGDAGEPPGFTMDRPRDPDAADAPEVLVLATAATVQSHAYRTACRSLGLHATEYACPLLVPLVEEGWIDHPVTRDVLRIYLSSALRLCTPRAVLLGCTHYPLLASAIEVILRELGCQAIVIDSAEAAAKTVCAALAPSIGTTSLPPAATFECFATDSIEKFRTLGSFFLERPIPEVHHLDLGG